MMGKSLSIDEFCRLEGICRSQFYVLQRNGEAPETYTIGKLVRISPAAHAEWRALRDHATAISLNRQISEIASK